MSDLTTEEITDRASDLLDELSDHIGDRDAVAQVLAAHLDELGSRHLGVVCAAAVLAAFGDCMSYIDPADVPTGSTIYGRTSA